MKRLIIGATVVALMTSSALVAQPRQNNNRDRHQQHDGPAWHEQSGRWDNGRHRGWGKERGRYHRWSRGEQMGYDDWRYAQRVDYRRYNLRQPPRGYDWRRINNRFVLVAQRSGIIVSVVLYNRR